MNTVFFGSMYLHANSVEGEVKYFYTPSYQSMLSTMIQYLVDEKLVDAKEHGISFSNSIDFLSNGECAWATVEGSNKEQDLENLLSDLASDNLEDEGWFTYKAAGGGVIDDKWLVMTIAYNENHNDVGYNQTYHTILGKNEEDIRKKFVSWAYENFGVGGIHLPDHIEKTIKLLNGRHPEDYDNNDCGGLDLQYRIENTSGKTISGESMI